MTYQELLRRYQGLQGKAQRRKFMQDHPNFAERFRRNRTIQGSIEGTIEDPFNDAKPGSPAGGAQQGVHQGMNPPQITKDENGKITITQPGPMPTAPTGPGGAPADPTPPPAAPDEEEPEVAPEEEEQDFNNDLMARLADVLGQVGLDTPELLDFARRAISKGWGMNEFMFELRKHPAYLANPLFAANMERTRQGARFMSEGEVLAWATETRRLAKQYGYNDPSDNYLAAGLQSGLSLAEVEHRFQIQDRINLYGAGVKMAAQEMGFEVGDEDLFEIFDPEKDTKEWEDMFRRAQMRGRPLTLGLGIRTEQEARALEMLGVDPEEAFKRYQGVASNSSRFARLGTIEENIRKGLPDDFGSSLGTEENSLLIRGLLFNDPEALARLQDITAREVARFKQGGGAATSGGQAVGLLSGAERQTFG